MQLREPNIEIKPDQPFANCKLGRYKYAEILTSIISETTDGCVIALNGEWGTGKTTFVKMWQQYLELNEFNTLYFNAWETDYISDPLVALIGELHKVKSTKESLSKFEKVKELAKVILTSLPNIAKCVLKGWIGNDGAEAIQNIIKEIGSIFVGEIEGYEKNCDSVEEFKSALAEWVDCIRNDKPLVFIVDELDRCNPHYAVKVLERIKHFF